MKKFLPLVVFLFIFLAVTKTARATTTLFLGGNIGGGESVTDGTIPALYTGEHTDSVVNITYIKRIELVLEYQKGTSRYYFPVSQELSIFKIGYPIVDEKTGLVFLTIGYQNFKRDHLTEARGFMVGLDLYAVASDNFFAGVDVQYSLTGAEYKRFYPYFLDLSMDQLSVKLKLQYTITEHIGLMANFQWFQFNTGNGLITENIISPSVGVVYRF